MTLLILLGLLNFVIAQPKISAAAPLPSYLQADFEKNCAEKLSALKNDLEKTQIQERPPAELKSEGAELLKVLWGVRLNVHRALARMNPDCILKARHLFHQIRDNEDYIGEIFYAAKPLDPYAYKFQEEPTPIFDPQEISPTMVRPDFAEEKFEFRSGDVVLARGISFFSAIITKLSTNQSHFSHSFIVHVPKSGHPVQSIESYVAHPVQAFDISYALRNENVRLMVLRPKDSAVGAAAAEAALKLTSKKIRYDYKMNFEDSREMSCVEVPVYSYNAGSIGAVKIPALPAQVTHRNDDLLSRLGISRGPLITPDDLETDPRFDLVLEWKNSHLVRNSRLRDAILAEVLRWSDELGYKFHSSAKTTFATKWLLPLRKSFAGPLVAKLPLVPELDPHIPPETLNVMTALDQVSQKILDQLIEEDQSWAAKNQRPMTNLELRSALEKMRVEDFGKLQRQEKTLFHSLFRPDQT